MTRMDADALLENDLLLLRAIFGDKRGGRRLTPEERIAWMRARMPKTYRYLAAKRLLAEFAGD